MLLGERLEFSKSLKEKLKSEGATFDMRGFTAHIQAEHVPHSVIIDCTSSEKWQNNMETWLRQGIHVITPNKKAILGAFEDLSRASQSRARNRESLFL